MRGRRSAQNVGEKSLNNASLPSRRRPREKAKPLSSNEAEALPLLLNLSFRSRYQNAQMSSELITSLITSRGDSCLLRGRIEGIPITNFSIRLTPWTLYLMGVGKLLRPMECPFIFICFDVSSDTDLDLFEGDIFS